MTRRPRPVAHDWVDGHQVLTSRLYGFPREMGAVYHTTTINPGWLVQPTVTPARGIQAALRNHADALAALVGDRDAE